MQNASTYLEQPAPVSQSLISRPLHMWRRLSLTGQFLLMSLLVTLAGMWSIGYWVNSKIEAMVIQNTAVSAALYLNGFVTPQLQELAKDDQLTAATISKIEKIYHDSALDKRIPSFKIWGLQGQILYSTNQELIGQTFPISEDKQKAWQGEVTAELSELDEDENVLDRDFGVPLLEIYSPIYALNSDRIIAVAEFYDDASQLSRQLLITRTESWLFVAGITMIMFILKFAIVRHGNRVIDNQRHELQTRINQLSSLLEQNESLHRQIHAASGRAVELNERFLRRIGAELHDGPAQAIGYALLRFDALLGDVESKEKNEMDRVRHALQEALRDIRNLSAGLAVPELAEMTLSETLRKVIRNHQHRTNTEVKLCVGQLPESWPQDQKIGIYRFVQEALNNAYRHANGLQQQVRASFENAELIVEVHDGGPGFDTAQLAANSVSSANRLGIAGMRERIESLGGRFRLHSEPGQGTHVIAYLSENTNTLEPDYG